MKLKNTNNAKSSGQVILIAVFAMALILLSTQVYVFEVQLATVEVNSDILNDCILTVQLSSRNVVIGSLANVSRGGSINVLATNLEKWSSIVGEENQLGRGILNSTVESSSPYSSGVWLYWGDSGSGVSSAFAAFTFELFDMGTEVSLSYDVNVTSTLLVQGAYSIVLEDEKQVNVTISLLNEGKPAPAQQIALLYRVWDSWLAPNASNNYVLFDYGNGTYRISFDADIPSLGVEVSIQVTDQRGIFVQANAACSQI